MIERFWRFLDRISRPSALRTAPPRRRERLRAITIAKNLLLGCLLAISITGLTVFALLALAPQALVEAENGWRRAHWHFLHRRISTLDAAITAGQESVALQAAEDLFNYATANVKVLDHGYEAYLQSMTRAMRSPFPTLRKRGAEASIAHHDYDSLAWLTLARARGAAGETAGAEEAYLKALAMRPYWPQASRELQDLYAKTGRRADAEQLKLDSARASLSLAGAGLPVHVVIERSDKTATGWMRMLDNCRPRTLRFDIPPGARSGYLVLPAADGLLVRLHRLESVPLDDETRRPWRITRTDNANRLSANEFVTAISPDAPDDAAPSIGIEAIGEGSGGRVELEMDICPSPALMSAAGLRRDAKIKLKDEQGRRTQQAFALRACVPSEVARTIPTGTTEVELLVDRSLGYLRVQNRGDAIFAANADDGVPLGSTVTGSFVLGGMRGRGGIVVSLYRGGPLQHDRNLELMLIWCDLDVTSVNGEGGRS